MMNQQEIQGNWNEIKGKLQRRWAQLTEDDLRAFSGSVDELVGTIQRKTGESREAIEHYLSQLAEQGADMAEQARQYAQQARERVGQASAMVSEQFRTGLSSAEGMVRERPGQSLAAAFGAGIIAGLVVGLLIRPRS